MRKVSIGRSIAIAITVAPLLALGLASLHQPALAQTVGKSAREIPRFQVDPSWPKIPNGWTLGQVASAASDDDDNIWILHRPRVVRPDQKTGPPVMEFDLAGNYLQGWGGRRRATATTGRNPSMAFTSTIRATSGSAAAETRIRF